MRIYEYETKELLSEAGIAIPRSGLAHSPGEAAETASSLGFPVVLKAQTLVKARGKAGLIQFAESPKQAEELAASLLGREHHGETIKTLLVEEKLDLAGELYLGIAVDYTAGVPVVLAGRAGGIEVEETAGAGLMRKFHVTPSLGLKPEQAGEVALFLAGDEANSNAELVKQLREVILTLYRLFVERDMEMLELNPLALVPQRGVIAVDGAAVLDGDALWRQPDLVRPRNQTEAEFEQEKDHRNRGWSYLQLDGDIGILSSGAGITMAILDLMRMQGGRPANFLDTAQMDRKGIYDAFQLFKGDAAIKTVLVNIFAGLNRCDHLAEGIKDFLQEFHPDFNLVVRMAGNREEEGKRILEEIGVTPIRELEGAVEKAIEVTEGRA
jgi:succinyl-CoA synthetase beta subunit